MKYVHVIVPRRQSYQTTSDRTIFVNLASIRRGTVGLFSARPTLYGMEWAVRVPAPAVRLTRRHGLQKIYKLLQLTIWK